MRLAATLLVVFAVTCASIAPGASSAPTEEIVLIGRSDLLAQNAPAPRRISRIERYVAPSSTAINDPVLATLDDQQTMLLGSMRPSQPPLEQFTSATAQVDSRTVLAGNLPVATSMPVEDPLSLAVSSGKPRMLRPRMPATTICLVLLLLVGVAQRRRVFAAVNWLVLRLAVAVHRPGARIRSPRRRRRRRSSSRRRAPDVSWYFRGASDSGRSRSSRRRWSRSSRPREYVVTDVVYATAPAQPSHYLLLSNSEN